MAEKQNPVGPFALSLRAVQLYHSDFLKKLVEEVTQIDGWLCNMQIPLMWDIASRIKGNFVEVGAWKGRTSVTLLLGAHPENFHLDVVDIFTGSSEHQETLKGGSTRDEFEFNLRKYGLENRVSILQKPSVEASKEYTNNSIDGIFIDAAHDFENVKNDILAWYPKLKSGAPMLFHDYPQPNPDGSHNPESGFSELFNVLNQYVRDAKDKFKEWGFVAGLAGAVKI